jgi:hypothetical protein
MVRQHTVSSQRCRRLSPGCTLDDLDLLLRQPIQLIHQRVNLPVRGLDLPLVEFLVGGGSGTRSSRKGAKTAKPPFVSFAFFRAIRDSSGQFAVQRQHALHQRDPLIVKNHIVIRSKT